MVASLRTGFLALDQGGPGAASRLGSYPADASSTRSDPTAPAVSWSRAESAVRVISHRYPTDESTNRCHAAGASGTTRYEMGPAGEGRAFCGHGEKYPANTCQLPQISRRAAAWRGNIHRARGCVLYVELYVSPAAGRDSARPAQPARVWLPLIIQTLMRE